MTLNKIVLSSKYNQTPQALFVINKTPKIKSTFCNKKRMVQRKWHQNSHGLMRHQHGGSIAAGLMAMSLAPQLQGAFSKVINVKGSFQT